VKPFVVNRGTRLTSPATVPGDPARPTAERSGLLMCAAGTSEKIGAVRTSRMIFGDGPAGGVAR
jgi:hypothetical protein